MAEILRYVNTASVGGDGTTNATTGPNAAYSSLVAWNTAEAADLVTAQNTHIVYCEGGADAIAQNTDINMSAWITDSNYYVTITVDSANRSTLGKLDTSKYHLYKVGSSSWSDIIKYVKYTKVIGLQFYIRANSGTNATRQCLLANTTSEVALTVENCIFDCGGTSAAYTGRPWNITAAGPNYFRNNIVIFDSNLFGAQVLSTTQGSGADNTFIYNNTFIDKNKTAYVFNINNSTNSVWKNNIFQGFLDHFTVGTGGNITGSDYNLTDLPAISYSTNNTVNTKLNFGDSYLLSTADFQVLSEGIGPSLDVNVPTTDILGNSRSGDITSVGALNVLSLNYLKLDSQSYSRTHISATLIADADLFSVVIDPPPGYAVHNVTDLSQAWSPSSIYYSLSVSIGDQFLYKTTTETNNWSVSVASDGILTTTPTGADTVKFWHWNQLEWTSELTYSLTSSISPLSTEVTPFNVSTFDTNVLANRVLICDSANYSAQTFEVGNLLSRRLIVNESSFSIVYQEVSVIKISAIKIEAITQTYSIIASEASLLRGLAIPVTAQAFTLTGPPVSTLANRILTSDAVTYTRTFNDAFITKSSVILATTKTYQISSFPITTPRTYGLLCSHAGFSINGPATQILKQSKLSLTSNNFDLTEQTSQLKLSRTIINEFTSFSLIAPLASVTKVTKISLVSASYAVGPQQVTLAFVRKLSATSKSFLLTYSLTDLDKRYALATTVGLITTTLPTAGIYVNRRIYMNTQTYFVPIRVWDGGAWTPKPLKIWTGTEWQIIL